MIVQNIQRNKKNIGFVRGLAKEMVETFPDFRENPYYNQNVDDYEQKLINLHLKSTIAFMVIYKLKMLYRKIKSKKIK